MKSVLISIKPQWCEKICNKIGKKDGKPIFEKPIEVRKGKPSEVLFKAFIYCTKSDKYLLDRDSDGSMFCWDKKEHHYPFKYEKDHKELFNGKVIGEFICDKVEVLFNTNGNPENYMTDILPTVLQKTALSFKEFQDYVGSRSDKNNIYGWHISDLKIYDKPKELREFRKPLDRVWCSYCNDYCDRGCISFGSTDYSCNDYWVYKQPVSSISVYPHDIVIHTCDDVEMVCMKMYGESWFLTEEEAKKRLEELENANM